MLSINKNKRSKKWWDKYFLDLARHASTASKDPSTQVGAVIVDDKNRVVSLGYNGFPRGVEDSVERYMDKEFKYSCVVHAEENAILNATKEDLSGTTLYLYPLMPCSHCASRIIQKGIKEVIIFYKENNPNRDYGPSEELLKEAGVKLTVYEL